MEAAGDKQDPHTGGPEDEEQGGGVRMGKGLSGRRWAGGTPLTYLAKKDFCSWGFLAFCACSSSRRSMKAAVSGLEKETGEGLESASEEPATAGHGQAGLSVPPTPRALTLEP